MKFYHENKLDLDVLSGAIARSLAPEQDWARLLAALTSIERGRTGMQFRINNRGDAASPLR